MNNNVVILDLKKYEDLKAQINLLANEVLALKLKNKRQEETTKELKEEILNTNIRTFEFKEYTLEELLDHENKSYALGYYNVEELEKLGIDLDEQYKFIEKKYKEWEKENK